MPSRPFDVSVTIHNHDFLEHRTAQLTHGMPGHWIYARPLFESGVDTVAMLDKPAGYTRAPSNNPASAFLIYVIHGELRLLDAEQSLSITPGMVAFTPGYFSTTRHCPVDTWFAYAQLTPGPVWSALAGQTMYARSCDYMDVLVPALGRIFLSRELQTSTARQDALEYARLTVDLLKRELRYISKSRTKQPSEALADLISRVRERPEYDWTLDSMAAEIGTSKRSLGRLVKDEYGISPMEMVIQNRIELAARQLTRTNLKIDEIADMLNYGSTSSFSDLFVRYTGKRPGQFRRDYRKEHRAHEQ